MLCMKFLRMLRDRLSIRPNKSQGNWIGEKAQPYSKDIRLMRITPPLNANYAGRYCELFRTQMICFFCVLSFEI